jgi:hypothetical protein
MAHFAQIDENNIVMQVIVVGDSDCLDENDQESEAVGIAFCQSLLGSDTNWVQTSYNATKRKHFAGAGFIWDAARDAFYPPSPYNSWTLNETTCQWEPPVARPDNFSEQTHYWDEENQQWAEE